ncbi:MAG: bestrophin family ion channel [Bryobacteraceae bacterium]
MHAARHYTLREVMAWTSRETAVFLAASAVPTVLFAVAGWTWMGVPWQPIALLGTAVAFVTGFKNNAAYARLWEGRQVWGGIINSSRTFAVLVLDFIPEPAAQKRIFHRHFAWLTALRYQLREPRVWENQTRSYNAEFRRKFRVAESELPLEPELARLLQDEEYAYILARKNRAAQLIHVQSQDLRRSAEASIAGELRHIEMQRQLAAFLDAQGRCERLKNYPYPRQFATLNLLFVWIFVLALPFGLLPELQKLGGRAVWLTIPASTLIAWVFHTMDKIGESSENPFEGGPNDVPITAMSRTIEIDMREMLGETELPPAVQAVNNILM